MEANTFIGFCPSNGAVLLQQNIKGEILCLHADTREQELKEIIDFFQKETHEDLSIDERWTLIQYLKLKFWMGGENVMDKLKDKLNQIRK